MAKDQANSGHGGPNKWRVAGWGFALFLLVLPLVAMQYTSEVNWTGSDFVFAGVLFGSVGLAFELIVRSSSNLSYRAGAALAVIAAFLTIWVNGAVGMIGSEDNPYNLLFGCVLVIALFGSLLARFQPQGMARTMLATATAQAALSGVGMSSDPRGGVFSLVFTGLWVLSAGLLHNARRDRVAAVVEGTAK